MRKNKITKSKIDPERLRILYKRGASDADIAEEFGVTVPAIEYQRRKFGCIKQRSSAKEVDIDKFHAMYNDGATDTTLAKEFEIPLWRVHNIRQLFGYVTQTTRRVNYERIRELYDEGLADLVIAKELGISSVTVSKWRHDNDLPITNTHYRRMIEVRHENNILMDEMEKLIPTKNLVDDESLFHDTAFLEDLMQRKLR